MQVQRAQEVVVLCVYLHTIELFTHSQPDSALLVHPKTKRPRPRRYSPTHRCASHQPRLSCDAKASQRKANA